MAAGPHNLRRSSRHRSGSGDAFPSGSEYQGSEKSALNEEPQEEEEEEEEQVIFTKSSRGRQVQRKSYAESASEPDDEEIFAGPSNGRRSTRSRSSRRLSHEDEDEEEEDDFPVRRRTRSSNRHLSGFIASDDDAPAQTGAYGLRLRQRSLRPPTKPEKDRKEEQRRSRELRASRRGAKREEVDDYEPQALTSSPTSADADGSFDEDNNEEEDDMDLAIEMNDQPQEEEEEEPETDGKPYALRQRQKVNYAIPPPLEEMVRPPPKPTKSAFNRRTGPGGRRKGPGWSASGAELGRWMGLPGDDSDSDHITRTPRKNFGGLGAFGGGVAGGGGGLLAGDLAAAGTPSNLGRVGDATLADADPLGVNVNVTFDEVGGLDDHINSLKEMTVLPLLYPEVFQQFKVTPPRGVLFHGPPGTGKTLLARALAASCRSNGKQISFFMRKGADALSKWVGEAERQLRLLFEEAKNSQPSIIFFDEIDGLAPVRSSKQDQIHASIVSTLLALMDGMDGRGQVVVIGATNRPDAIDPALRRPGRFDREFYFPLPGLEAREKILGIMTKGWKGWGEEDGAAGKERLKGLAKLTKGYGGADLRALCTEAALNAVQRKYPQIYKSNDRLLLKPDSVQVGLRDFMISIKKIVPSSARSSSTAAAPLPPQFVPLLSEPLEQVKKVIEKVLPMEKKLTALEEAEYEDYEGEEGALEREMTLQSMEKLRIYRPRIVLHGPAGMGQGYVGAAVLHFLEGYHIQSLELGSLMGDSTRTVEAGIVQLFVEAKRHQPSVIYIPSLLGWCAAVPETARSTVRAMLDTLSPTDPILLIAIVDSQFLDLPRDVRSWFGLSKDNRVEVSAPTEAQRVEFFKPLVEDVRRPPNQFADGMPRKKRILEDLPIAPPPEPRKPSAAELAAQEESDQRTITLLKFRLGPILNELKRKFKRFAKAAREEYRFDFEDDQPQIIETVVEVYNANGTVEIMEDIQVQQPLHVMNGAVNGVAPAPELAPPPQVLAQPKLFDMDLEKIHTDLYRDRYLTPQEFMDDLKKIVHNAEVRAAEDLDRFHKAQAMYTAAEVSIQEFDLTTRLECERMAVRERKRREEYKKTKELEKEKEKEQAGLNGISSDTGVAGTRRSARNNGLQPELKITDPVKLERRLKRQREGGGSESHASEEEHGENRDMKRSKMLVDDDDRDELELTTPPRPSGVRFATPSMEAIQPFHPMASGSGNVMRPGPSFQPTNPTHPLHPGHFPHPQHPESVYLQNQSQPFQPMYPQHPMHSHQPMYPQQNMQSMQPHSSMYSPQPMPSHQQMHPHQPMYPNQQMPHQQMRPHQPMQQHPSMQPYQSIPPTHSLHPMQNSAHSLYPENRHLDHSGRLSHSPHPMHPAQSFPAFPDQQQTNDWNAVDHVPGPTPFEQSNDMVVDVPQQGPSRSAGFDPTLLNPLPDDVGPANTGQSAPGSRHTSIPPTAANDDPFLSKPLSRQTSVARQSKSPHPPPPQKSKSPEPPKEPSPVPIPRTPTPLPDFHVDENMLAQLQSSLKVHTASLTIEQLEQLRATCLSCIWRSRKEWDRGPLIRELQDLVNDFVEEVGTAEAANSEDER
ncbi:aaa family atpase [Moniliophthora roreri MCA 2997]|uniref:Aaa family atpase n=1 Tax=Moniliophthora roreri (strain MCA 2997) TaxID=1381753 RepID=V2X114_MONRO|nr:aaa family atpase [Moniliophthora roreri MCA 2997]